MYSVYIPEIFILDFDWFYNKEAREAALISLEKSKEIPNLNYDSTFKNFFIDNPLYYYSLKFKNNFHLWILDSPLDIEMFKHQLWLNLSNIFMHIVISNLHHLYSSIIISIQILNKSSINNCKKIVWTDIWKINTYDIILKNYTSSFWNLYYRYNLILFNLWHILENRIIILLSVLLLII